MAYRKVQLKPPHLNGDVIHPETTASVVIEEKDKRFMTDSERSKLAGIEAGANKYVHPESHPATMIVEDTNHRFVSDLEKNVWNSRATTSYVDQKIAELVNSAPSTLDTLKELSNALGNDPNFATTMANELGKKVDKVDGKQLSTNDYTNADRNKLAGIQAGAEVNQNAFSNVKVGTINVTADSKTDTLELVAGSNVTLTPDATNDKITISAKDTTYSNATTSSSGLMSSSDKSKLDGIESGANRYILPVADSTTIGGVKSGGDINISSTGIMEVKDNSHNHTIDNVTGLQSALDSKLNAGENAVSASKLNTARTISISGDASGSASFDGTKNIDIAVEITDDSHNHVIENVDGLQDALDSKAPNSHIGTGGTSHATATSTVHGFMSASDKSKLDGIEAGANKYIHPTGAGHNHIPSGGSSGQVLKWSANGVAVWETDNDTKTYINGKTGTITKDDIVALGITPKSTSQTITLSAGSWSGSSAPFSYTISVSGVTASNVVEIVPQNNLTAEQVKAMANAMIVSGTQSTNSITLRAYGKKPTVNLPIVVIVRGDL